MPPAAPGSAGRRPAPWHSVAPPAPRRLPPARRATPRRRVPSSIGARTPWSPTVNWSRPGWQRNARPPAPAPAPDRDIGTVDDGAAAVPEGQLPAEQPARHPHGALGDRIGRADRHAPKVRLTFTRVHPVVDRANRGSRPRSRRTGEKTRPGDHGIDAGHREHARPSPRAHRQRCAASPCPSSWRPHHAQDPDVHDFTSSSTRTTNKREVTGLQGDQRLMGIDFRVQDGGLYDVGDTGSSRPSELSTTA